MNSGFPTMNCDAFEQWSTVPRALASLRSQSNVDGCPHRLGIIDHSTTYERTLNTYDPLDDSLYSVHYILRHLNNLPPSFFVDLYLTPYF